MLLLLTILLTTCQLLLNRVNGANILAITPMLSRSHHIWTRVILIALAERGHNVTFIGPDKEKIVTPNLTGIHFEGVYEKFLNKTSIMSFADMNPIEEWNGFFEWGITQCTYELDTNGFQKLRSYPPNSFDLIITDTAGNECFYPLIEYFGSPPIVGVSAYGLIPWASFFTGDYEYPAIVPTAGHLTNRMSFSDRFWNFIYTSYIIYNYKYYYIPKLEQINKEYYGYEMIMKETIENMNKKMSIYIANIHPVMDFPRPTMPGIIPASGMHIKPSEPIPNNIKNYLDNAKEGFILFSLGTNVQSVHLKKDRINAILKAFEQLPLKVLWKWESDSLPGKPENVMIQKWLPAQGNILAHKNIRLFITHGGALSTQESLYHGVPIVGIPIFADQRMNVNRMVERGYGQKVEYSDLTFDNLLRAIQEVLNNPKYKENIQKASARFRDQPQTSLERAVFWTEYVLRHGGAQHLQPPSIHMSAYQAYSLDIVALLLAIIIAVISIPIYLCQCLCKARKSTKKVKIN